MGARGTCPRRGHVRLVDTYTGEVRPGTCDSPACGYCGPWRAKLAGLAIGMAKPTQAIVITHPGDHYDQIRRRINRAVYRVRSSGLQFDFAWAAEYSSDGGVHVHLALHGDHVPTSTFGSALKREGTGVVLSQPVRNPVGFGLYLMKWPAGGLDHDIASAEILLSEVRVLNGTRTVNASRGFWRDPDGRRLTGIRAALRLVRQLSRDTPSLS
jgi:hypothetical protein